MACRTDRACTRNQGGTTETITSRNGLVMQRAAEFITGKRDIHDDATWDAYLDELQRAGVERYVELWQEALQSSGYFN